jgi:type IV secretion system protein TrbL
MEVDISELDPLWLNEIQDTFTEIFTRGFLLIHPWVMNLFTVIASSVLVAGIAFYLMYPYPITFLRIGKLILRVAVLSAIVQNWLYITDGFMNSVVWVGMRMSGTALSNDDFLRPGRLMLIGIRLSANFYAMTSAWSEDWVMAPVMAVVYAGVYFVMIVGYFLIATASMFVQIEFQIMSLWAFAMFPLMNSAFIAWIATDLVREVILSALKLGLLALLVSIILPFSVSLGLPGDTEIDIQAAIMLALGVGTLAILIKKYAAWPGSGIMTLGLLTALYFKPSPSGGGMGGGGSSGGGGSGGSAPGSLGPTPYTPTGGTPPPRSTRGYA